MPEVKIFLSAKGCYIPPNQTFAIERLFYFCLMKSCVSRKPFMSSIIVPSQSVIMASSTALTEENIDIIRQCGFNIVQHIFFHVFNFFCSFLFLIRNTRDRSDSVNFWLLATRMSELSQKYDYPLLIVPDLIRFFKYKISIHK